MASLGLSGSAPDVSDGIRKNTSDGATNEEIKTALPKLVSFFKAFELNRLLKLSKVADMMWLDEDFAKFLKSEFRWR